MKSILLLLGSPNDNKGNLSQIAKDRNNCAYELYKSNNDIKLVCTGGFGEHFNTTNIPHAQYAKDALIQKGVSKADFLPLILSSNTYDDFIKSKGIIEKEQPDLLIIVSSDFHIDRVRLLHEKILDYPHTIFIPAKSSLSAEELHPLIKHEQKAIERLTSGK